MTRRALLLGGSGLLGQALRYTAPVEFDVAVVNRIQVDITRPHEVARALEQYRPEIIVNAAAYTAVDEAESNTTAAFAVNAEAVDHIGRVAAQHSIYVVHFSSDYVFNGRALTSYAENADTDPLNVYGSSKRAGEERLIESRAQALIVRTQALFGPGGPSFVATMRDRARARSRSVIVQDQFTSPSYSRDVAAATWALVEQTVTGTIHVTNAGEASWYDVGAYVYGLFGIAELCTPCMSDEYSTAATRPRYSCLTTHRLPLYLSQPLPTWTDAVSRFIAAAELWL